MNKHLLRAMGSCLWALAMLACAGASPGDVRSGEPQGNGQSSDPNAYACQTADDCVAVETACCDHCNGGKVVAFNKAHADKHRPKGCEDARCTARGCGAAIPVCVNNRCQIELEQRPSNAHATQSVAGSPDDVAAAEDPQTNPPPSRTAPSISPRPSPPPPPPSSPPPSASQARPCAKEECRGPQPALPSQLCPDGKTVSGPACIRKADDSCVWTIQRCP